MKVWNFVHLPRNSTGREDIFCIDTFTQQPLWFSPIRTGVSRTEQTDLRHSLTHYRGEKKAKGIQSFYIC